MRKLLAVIFILFSVALSGCTCCNYCTTSRYTIHVTEPCCTPVSTYNPIRFHHVPLYYTLTEGAVFEGDTNHITPIPEDAKTIYTPIPF